MASKLKAKTNARKTLSSRVRFEVFKRDKFTCQYCGLAAPEVVLHLDHIHPIAEGGTNDIMNLVTSCATCNLGKGARKLEDVTAITKQLQQLKELEERREQLDLMLAWRMELQGLEEDTAAKVLAYWSHNHAAEVNKDSLRRLLKRYPVKEVLHAIDLVTERYVDACGGVTYNDAFKTIQGICKAQREDKANPDLAQLYYVRGILRNRLGYRGGKDYQQSIQALRAARAIGAPIEDLKAIALAASDWSDFYHTLECLTADIRAWQGSIVEDFAIRHSEFATPEFMVDTVAGG